MNLVGSIINSLFTHNFPKMPKRAKIRRINVSIKWKQWHSKAESKTSTLFTLLWNFSSNYQGLPFFHYLMFLKYLPRVEPKLIQSISGTQINHSIVTNSNRSLIVWPYKRPPIAIIASHRTISDQPKLFELTKITQT